MTIVAVQRPGALRVPAPRDRRPMTRITGKVYRETFIAPNRGDGRTRREMWAARSVCGEWRYERQDDGIGTLWTVTHVPTGQVREGFGTSSEARRETAGRLLDVLRREAFAAALTGPVEGRLDGQRLLARHMKAAGADEADARCRCGGLLVYALRGQRRWAHVDGCSTCYEHGEGLLMLDCPDRAEHKFCSLPVAVECVHYLDHPRVCGELALPNGGKGCGRGQSGDCCTACCNGE